MLISPKTIFKILQSAGVKLRFDAANEKLILITDDGENEHSFADIEKMVNGDE